METLVQLKAGSRAKITGINGSGAYRNRVCTFGFMPGTRLVVVDNRGNGPVLVRLRDTLVALGRREAAAVNVKTVNPEASHG